MSPALEAWEEEALRREARLPPEERLRWLTRAVRFVMLAAPKRSLEDIARGAADDPPV